MLVTLRRASVTFFEGFGLIGFIETEDEAGKSETYPFRLPTAEEPNPPGWSSIERLAKISAETVIGAWDESHTYNQAANDAALDVTTRFRGERFIAEVTKHNETKHIDLIAALDPHVAAPKRRHADEVELEVLPRYTQAYHIAPVTLPGEAAEIVISLTDVEESKWIRFKVPDQNDRTPADWWYVACFTGIAHERVASSWTRDGNKVLDDVVRILGQAIEEYNHVPLKPDGTVDMNRWRGEMIRHRFARGIKPFVFLGRPDHNIEHTRAIFYDVAGEYVFRANVDPGKSFGCPAMILASEKKAMLKYLDDIDALRGILVRYIRFASTGRPPRPKNPPKELLVDLVRYPDPKWPIITGIVRIPTMRDDGTIITKEGYDRLAALWYAPEFELEPIPEHPTMDDVQRARALLLTPIADFPFLGDGARTGALACLFEQVVRPMIKGPRPLYIFDAPEQGQGTGKTLLAKIFQVIITGGEPTISALGKREEEVEKRLTTILKQQEPFVILDNLTKEITSEALQQLATSERWQARLLNTNDAPILAQNATWVMTLNGAKMNRDMARRVVLVRLDAKMTNAFERTGFKIPDVVAWARDRRASLIRAALILARSWVHAGRPGDKDVVRGSFERWCEVIGGIMKHAGFVKLADALKASTERDINVEDHRLLVRAWVGELGTNTLVPAMKVGELALKWGLYDEQLGPKRNAGPMAVGKIMGNILRSSVLGQTIEGFRVHEHPTEQNGYHCWVLTPIEPVN